MKYIIWIIIIVLLVAGWYFLSPLVFNKEVNEDLPTNNDPSSLENSEPKLLAAGNFQDADNFHKGSGEAMIYDMSEAELLRFENFSVTNGPDLHVLLSTSENPLDDLGEYVDLGDLKGNMGNQNYEIPENVDTSLYKSIVIYCKPFHVVFSFAKIN